MKKKINEKNKSNGQNKILIIGIMCLIIFVIIGIFCAKIFKNDKSNGELFPRTDRLRVYRNDDDSVVGWIKVNGTNIDYAVHLGNTNSNNDIIWTNDTLANGENRKIVLGHNILNVSKKPLVNAKMLTRFEPLMAYVYQDFVQEHLYIQYVDIDSEESLYKIYAISFYSGDEDVGESYTDEKDITNYIEKVRKASIYDLDVDVDYQDELITLATCTRYFGVNGPKHFKIDARKVRKNEKISNYSVKKSNNYDIMNKE